MDISRRAYLRSLGLFSSISLSGLFSGDVGATSTTEPEWGEPVPTGSTRVPVDNPHITLGHGTSYTYGTDAGIPDLTRPELATEVLKLHPDFWNQRYASGMTGDPFYFEKAVPEMARDGIDLAATLSVPASLGFAWMVRDEPVEERPTERGMSGYLDDLPPEEQWPAPDGTPAERPLHESTARDLSGNVNRYHEIGPAAAYSVSMYAPGPTNYHLDNHENAPLYGANATEMDLTTGVSNLMTGDYSIWGKRAFREYLKDLPQNRLNRLEIDDISNFDIQSYAQNLRHEVSSGKRSEADVIQDPIIFEFRLMEHRRLLEYYETYWERGHTSAEQVESPLTTLGNQQSSIVSPKSTAALILSQARDLIEMEENITLPGHRVDEPGNYWPGILTTLHKRAAAVSRAVDKPVVEHGFYKDGDARDGEIDGSERYPSLLTLNTAEVYANGSTRQMDLDGWNSKPPDNVSLMWLNAETGSVPDDIRPLADFLWLHEEDLQGTSRSDVAIVYSIPTMLAKIRPFVGRRGNQEAKSLDGWVRAARERQIPTDMIIFGHPELWDDSGTLDRLSDYQTLILPQVSALTNSQYEAIREFITDGGTVLMEGELGTYDGYYRPKTDSIADLERVKDAGDAGIQATNGDISAAGDAIEQSLQSPLVQVDGPPTLSCEVIETEDGWKNLHLVNYDYDSNSDSAKAVSDVKVSLLDPGEAVQDVDVIAPFDDRKSLDAARSGEYISATVPEVAVWGIVRFKTGTRSSAASESDAENAISDASTAVDEVSASGRSIPVVRGKAAIYEAELAKDANQYDRSIEKAKEASEQTKRAKKELHIGIDSGHGQGPEQNYDGLTEFREKYGAKYEITFSEINTISPEQLAELDGLLIGSASGINAYSYTEEELAVLEKFVTSGGRIAIVVSEGVDRDINSLTERFGITVDPRKINTPEWGGSNSILTQPAQYRTPITYQILEKGWMPQACSLKNLEEDVTVQIQSNPNTLRKGSSEKKQFPVSAVSRKGNGAVVVQTSDVLFKKLKYNFEVQARNILRFIGDAENEIKINDLTPEGTDTSGPGFGTISALTGLIGAFVYCVYRNLDREE